MFIQSQLPLGRGAPANAELVASAAAQRHIARKITGLKARFTLLAWE
jgi:hypothetical protein